MTVRPFLCKPIYQPWLWGGRNLARALGRELPAEGPVAESWEVSDVDGAVSQIESEPHAGKSLRQLIAEHGDAILGGSGAMGARRRFPLLVKYLDAHDLLSVQVHPGDEYAAVHEENSPGKSEMWLILEAEPGAEVIAGLKPGIGRAEFAEAIRHGCVPETVRRYPVKAGDVILMPAGRVHALGSGTIALEIQQTSDVTYRIYDWGRLGADGKLRAVHTEKALDVITFDDTADPKLKPVTRSEIWGTRKLLTVTPYFLVEAWDISDSFDPAQPASTRTSGTSPDVLALVKGSARIAWRGGALALPHGRTAVVPASLGRYDVEFLKPSFLVRARVPDLDEGLGEWTPTGDEQERQVHAVCDQKADERLFPSTGEDNTR